MELKKKENIGWIDLLRITACFLVVFAHCCDPFVARFDTDRNTFLQGCALGSAVRSCVPLFVMMTGVLLFPEGTPAVIQIICMAVLAFFISYMLVRAMSAFTWTRRFVA